MLMPLRCDEKGWQGVGASASRQKKPRRVMPHNVSMPPTIAASHRSAAIMRCALASGLALEVHAVETTQAGPRAPVSSETTFRIAPYVWWRQRS